jgi:thioredoxin 1
MNLKAKLKVGKLDVDNNQDSAIKYGVRSIPTVLIFKDGKVKETIMVLFLKCSLNKN